MTLTSLRPLFGIRGRLMLLALLAIAPLMADRVRVLEHSRTARLAEATAMARDFAQRGADLQHGVMVGIRAVLQSVSRSYVPAVRAESCDSFLRSFIVDNPWMKTLTVISAQGRITCSTSAISVGLDVSDRDYFRNAMIERDFVVSNFLIARARKEPSVIVAQPIAHATDQAAIVISSINLAWIQRLAASAVHNEAAAVTIVDGKGTVVADSTDPDRWIGKNVAGNPLAREIFSRTEGTATMAGIDGVRRIYAFVPVAWMNARLAVGLNESMILSEIDREIWAAYIQLALVSILILIGTWFLGDRLIAKPVRLLASKAARFGRGDLSVQSPNERWTPEFAPLVAALNTMAAQLAERERALHTANRHLVELASSDGLSGLANRRGFDARLTAEWQIACDTGQPLAILMIDVDHFKLYNDRYGHLEGDQCLRDIGEALAGMARNQGDLAARYGGEEFVLLLPGTEIDSALDMAESFRQRIEALDLTNSEAPEGRVTVSIGVSAATPIPLELPERLLEAADIGLYAAKRRGRNAVVAHATVNIVGPPAAVPAIPAVA